MIPILSILTGQAITLHIPFDTIPPSLPWTSPLSARFPQSLPSYTEHIQTICVIQPPAPKYRELCQHVSVTTRYFSATILPQISRDMSCFMAQYFGVSDLRGRWFDISHATVTLSVSGNDFRQAVHTQLCHQGA